MRSIFIREINSFFSSIVGYVAVIVFLTGCWLFLWVLPDTSMLDYGYATLDKFFDMAPWLLMILIPAVTMRSFSDEFKSGTIEWLSTKPLRDTDIILGKYFAAVALIIFALLPTLIYVYSIGNLAEAKIMLDRGWHIRVLYRALFLAAGFAAVGVFCSSLTSNQIVGFLVALFACALLYSGFEALSRIPSFSGGIEYYLSMIGMSFHYTSISRGVIDSRDVIFFLTVIALFIYLTKVVLYARMRGTGDATQKTAAVRILVLLGILVCVNMLASRFHSGVDLTEEKRFTLSNATKKFMRQMDDVAVIDVYLDGKNLPAGFQRLRESTRERLQSLREYAGPHIIFRFIDPFEGKSDKEKVATTTSMQDKGLFGVNIHSNNEVSYTEQVVFPAAMVHYKSKDMPVTLLENHLGMGPLAKLNYSESLLEYKFASAINELSKPTHARIAYIAGNNEAMGFHTHSALTTIAEQYNLDTLDLNAGTHINSLYDAAIICKPTEPFTEKQKFKIDQYIMHGGHVLWMLDMVSTNMDSLQVSEQTLAVPYNLNLDDILFKYGVRVNTDLIEDLQCNQIPVTTGFVDGKPNIEAETLVYTQYSCLLPRTRSLRIWMRS